MSSINKESNFNLKTYEGAPAKRVTAEQQLERLVMSCMLWEDQFYIDGESLSDQIMFAVRRVSPEFAYKTAIKARNEMKLRHVPLLIAREMARHDSQKGLVSDLIEKIIQRPDELTEYLSIYWKDNEDQSLSAQSKKGLARAFGKFNEYSLAKYNRKKDFQLKDVLNLVHPKPKDLEQSKLWKRLLEDKLEVPSTWEVELSKTDNVSKKEKWTKLLNNNNLGALALLRNLRNMIQENVDHSLIKQAILDSKVERVLPFRFIAAARYAPMFERELETKMFECLKEHKRFEGQTVLLIDVSGSMNSKVSMKSDMTRMDAACALSMLIREIADDVRIFTFSMNFVEVPSRHGFALRDSIVNSQVHRGTLLGSAVKAVYSQNDIEIGVGYDCCYENFKGQCLSPDRLIVFTDEQSHDGIPNPKGLGYMINIAAYKNGVGYGPWNHVDGFSEAIVDYIQCLEDLD